MHISVHANYKPMSPGSRLPRLRPRRLDSQPSPLIRRAYCARLGPSMTEKFSSASILLNCSPSHSNLQGNTIRSLQATDRRVSTILANDQLRPSSRELALVPIACCCSWGNAFRFWRDPSSSPRWLPSKLDGKTLSRLDALAQL